MDQYRALCRGALYLLDRWMVVSYVFLLKCHRTKTDSKRHDRYFWKDCLPSWNIFFPILPKALDAYFQNVIELFLLLESSNIVI